MFSSVQFAGVYVFHTPYSCIHYMYTDSSHDAYQPSFPHEAHARSALYFVCGATVLYSCSSCPSEFTCLCAWCDSLGISSSTRSNKNHIARFFTTRRSSTPATNPSGPVSSRMLGFTTVCLALASPDRLFGGRQSAVRRSVKPDIDIATREVAELLQDELPQAVPLPDLNADELAILDSGSLLFKVCDDAKSDHSNAGLAAQVIGVPAETVWQTILNFDEWPRMIDDVVETDVYEENETDFKVKVTIGVGFIRIRTHVHHVRDEEAGTLCWHLDGEKASDLVSNTGFWMVEPREDGASCIVYYSCSITLCPWAPKVLDRYVAREGLPRALGWLKREAEGSLGGGPGLVHNS